MMTYFECFQELQALSIPCGSQPTWLEKKAELKNNQPWLRHEIAFIQFSGLPCLWIAFI